MIQKLRSIVERKIGRSINYKGRKRSIVQAKMIFSLILNQNGISKKEIGRILGYDHTSIIHHVVTIKNIINQDNDVRNFYLSTKGELDSQNFELSLSDYLASLPINVLNYIDGLVLENKQLKLEAKQLREIKSDRLAGIFDLINNNTPIGAEAIIERKIKRLLNV